MSNEEPDLDSQEWVTEAISRLSDEIECLSGHWHLLCDEFERSEQGCDTTTSEEVAAHLYKTIKHLESLSLGCTTTLATVMTHAPASIIAEVVRERMETEQGVPIVMAEVTLPGGIVGYAYSQEKIVVPDDASELED